MQIHPISRRILRFVSTKTTAMRRTQELVKLKCCSKIFGIGSLFPHVEEFCTWKIERTIMKTPFAYVSNKLRRLNPCCFEVARLCIYEMFLLSNKDHFSEQNSILIGIYSMRWNSLWILSFLLGRLQCY